MSASKILALALVTTTLSACGDSEHFLFMSKDAEFAEASTRCAKSGGWSGKVKSEVARGGYDSFYVCNDGSKI